MKIMDGNRKSGGADRLFAAAVLATAACILAAAMMGGGGIDAAEAKDVTTVTADAMTVEGSDTGSFYIVKDLALACTSSGTVNVYVADGASLKTAGSGAANVIVHLATGASGSGSKTTVTYIDGLALAGSDGGSYKADVAGTCLISNKAQASGFGVEAFRDGSYTCYPEGKDIGSVDLKDEGSYVRFVDGSAAVNGAYTTGSGSSAATHVVQTVAVSGIKTTTPVTVSVTTAFASASAGGFTVSGGDAVAYNKEPATSGKIVLGSGSCIVSSADAAKLAKALNGFYADGAVFASAGGSGGADASKVSAVYGEAGSGQKLTGENGVQFNYAKASSFTIGSDGKRTVSVQGTACVGSGGILSFTSGRAVGISLLSGEFILQARMFGATTSYGQDITVSDGATLSLDRAATISGGLYLHGKLTSEGEVEYPITLYVEGSSGKIAVLRAYTGSQITAKVIIYQQDNSIVDISGAQKEEYLSGTGSPRRTVDQTQILIVRDRYEMTGEGSYLDVYGGLVIPEGTELVVSGGANITVSGTMADLKVRGTLTIEEGSYIYVSGAKGADVSGKICSEGGLDIRSYSFVVKKGASLDSEGRFNSTKMTVEAGGTVCLSGDVCVTGMDNAGSVSLREAKLFGSSAIRLTAGGAAVSIEDVAVGKNKTLEINDYRSDAGSAKSAVQLSAADAKLAPAEAAITGLKASSSGSGDSRTIDVSGTVSAEAAEGIAANLVISGTGLDVKDSLKLGENVRMLLDAACISVSGELTALGGAVTTTSASAASFIDVSGLLQAGGEIGATSPGTLTVNSAYYRSDGSKESYPCKYTSIARAIASGVSVIKILGKVTVDESAEVPSGMTLKIDGENKLAVGSETARDIVLTIKDGAKLTGSGEVNVFGSLAVENLKGCRDANIRSDVEASDGASARYTNIYTALADARPGETVKVTRADAVTLDSSITVKEGVTLNVSSGKTIRIAGDKVVVTVAGAMISEFGIDGFDKSKSTMKISGEFLTEEGTDAAKLFDKYGFAGAYYSVTDASGQYTHMTALESAVKDAALTEGIYVCGKVSVGDLEVSGTAEDDADIYVMDGAELSAGTVKLKDADLNIAVGARFTGTATCRNGTVEAKDVAAIDFNVVDDGSEQDIMAILGGPTAMAVGAHIKILNGTVRAGFYDQTFSVDEKVGLTVSENAALDVIASMDYAGKLLVEGTLDVDKMAGLTVGKVFLSGNIIVDTEAASQVLEADTVYVGFSGFSFGAAASFTAPAGSVSVKTVYLAPGSVVSEDVLSALGKSTRFLVEGAERFTVYTKDAAMKVKDVAKPEIAGAEVTGWDHGDDLIGSVAEVSAVIDRNVYHVAIVADYGFADIYIDGKKAASVSGGQVVYVDPDEEGDMLMAAGTHAVGWTLKPGYNGDKVVMSFDGKEFSGSFTITTDMEFKGTVHKLVLAGATQETAASGQGPYIIVIVVVILIAVMTAAVVYRAFIK